MYIYIYIYIIIHTYRYVYISVSVYHCISHTHCLAWITTCGLMRCGPGSPLFGPQCNGNTWSNNVQQCPWSCLGTCDGTFANVPKFAMCRVCTHPERWLRSEPPSLSWQREEHRLERVDKCFFISPMHRDLWIQREIKHKRTAGHDANKGALNGCRKVGLVFRFVGYVWVYLGTFCLHLQMLDGENQRSIFAAMAKLRQSIFISDYLRFKDYRNLGDYHYTQLQSVSGRDMSDTWTWTHDKLAAPDHEIAIVLKELCPNQGQRTRQSFLFLEQPDPCRNGNALDMYSTKLWSLTATVAGCPLEVLGTQSDMQIENGQNGSLLVVAHWALR